MTKTKITEITEEYDDYGRLAKKITREEQTEDDAPSRAVDAITTTTAYSSDEAVMTAPTKN